MCFQERKQTRKEYYEKSVKGWKLIPCRACDGSGYYHHNDDDLNGSPDCGACDGTGKIVQNIVFLMELGKKDTTRRKYIVARSDY